MAVLGFSSALYGQNEQVIEEITVVGVRSALQNALDNKRNSDVIMDGISADEIGNYPDLNLAESLQRVTGIQMDYSGDEGLRRMGRVAIRGLPTEYSVTTYNGQFLGAPRPDFGFSFGNVESSVISAVNVLKTTTARMDAGGLAGTVDLRTKRALDVKQPYIKLGLKTTYETMLEDYSPGYSLAFGSKFADDKWGIIGSVSLAEQHFRGDVVRVNGYNESDTDGDGLNDFYVPNQVRLISRDTSGDRVSATLGFEFQATDNLKIGLNGLYVDDPIFHDWGMFRMRRGTLEPLESVSDSTFGETVTRLNFVNPEIRAQQRLIDVENETRALTLDAEWLNEDWTVKGVIHRTEASQFAVGAVARRRLNAAADNGVTVLVDTGTGDVDNFEFHEVNNVLADINTYSNNGCTVDEIAAGRTESRCVNSSAGAGDWYTSYNSGHEYDTTDEETAFQLDVIRHFDNSVITTIEGGLKYRDTEQDFVRPEWELPNDEFDYAQIPNLESLISFADFASSNGEDFFGGKLANQIDGVYFQDGRVIRQALVGNMTFPGGTLDGLPVPADGGDIPNQTANSERDIFSAYIMATFDFSNLETGLPVRGNVGLRYVDTDRTAYGFRNPRGALEPMPISATIRFDHLLPSVNMIWDIRDDLMLRASYSETIVRPHTWNFRVHQFTDVTESAPGVVDSIQFDLGNADLEPFEADSIDLSLEWYNDVGSAVTLAYFQKKVSNGIDDRVLCPASISEIASIAESSQASLITGSLAVNAGGLCVDEAGVEVLIRDSVNNSDSFDINGYEVGVFQTFEFLDVPVIRNMGVQANYTYVDTSEGPDKDGSGNSLPLAGVSEDTYNLIVFYEGEQLAVRFAYTARTDYFDETVFTVSGDNRFIDTQDRLDMQITYSPKQFENFYLTFEAFNLTDEQFFAYQGTEKRFREAREVGKTLSLQATYQFDF